MKSLRLSLILAAAIFLAASGSEEYKLTPSDEQYLESLRHDLEEADRIGSFQPDPQVEQYLLQVITRLNGDAKVPAFITYRPRLTRFITPNASAAGNGTILVNPALLCALENENQLAAILAHEISHVQLRHGFKGYKQATTNTAIANVASLVVGYSSDDNALTTLVINSYSIDLEEAADRNSLLLLRQAGYDLSASWRSLERLRISYEGKLYHDPNIFQREHPKLQERIDYLKKAIATDFVGTPGNPAGEDHRAFVTRTLSARRLAVGLLTAAEEYLIASAYATDTLVACPGDAGAQMDMGVVVRQWALRCGNDNKAGERNEKTDKATMKDKPPMPPSAQCPRLPEALPYLTRAAELDPGLFTVERELGEYYAQAGDVASALKHFQRSLELNPPVREAAKIKRRMQSLSQPSGPAPAGAAPENPKPKE